MAVGDVYPQNRRLWVRLREAASGTRCRATTTPRNTSSPISTERGLRGDPKGPQFRTIGRGTGRFTRTELPRANPSATIGWSAGADGIATELGNHAFTNPDHGLSQEQRHARKAAAMAIRASARTAQLYDRRCDEVSPDEVGRIMI